MSYSQIAWLPLTGGLTLLGVIASWFAWKRRGVAAGLRGVAWSLLPLAAYLIGAIELLWRFGSAIGSFATSFVFSPKVWSGVAVIGVAIVLYVVSGGLRGRNKKKAGAAPEAGAVTSNGTRASGTAAAPARLPAAKRKTPAGDDDMADVEAILRRRGIN